MRTRIVHASSRNMSTCQTAGNDRTKSVAVGDRLAHRSSDKIVRARELKDEGNTAFKARDYRRAMKKYHYALMYTKGVMNHGQLSALLGLEHVISHMATDEEIAVAKDITLTISNNLAACFLQTEKWEKAVEYASKVLEDQPGNAKALYRRGTAYIHLNHTEEAKHDLKRAQEITPENGDIRKQLAVLEKKTREHEIKEQKLYSTMFGNQS